VIGKSKSLDREVAVEKGIVVPFLRGKDIRRYQPLESQSCLICPYDISEDESCLMSETALKKRFPKAYEYLTSNRTALESREGGRFKNQEWYAFGYPKSMSLFQKPKLVVPDYNNTASFTLDKGGHFFKTGYGAILTDSLLSPLYVLGVLNSKLLFLYLTSIGTALRGGYVRFWTQFIERLPIRTIDFEDSDEVQLHDRMVKHTETMLALSNDKASARSRSDLQSLERQIKAIDKQIEKLVFQLYELTPEEISIIEDAG
jgi:hypothetical protein